MARTFSTWKKVLAGLLLAVALIVAAVFAYRHKAQPFEEVYASIKDQVEATGRRHFENEWERRYWAQPAYMRGKAVVLDARDGHLDTRLDLPEELKASLPDEVGTIVLLSWDKVKTGVYAPRGSTPAKDAHGAFTRICHVTVIDRITRETIAWERFEGSQPPATSSGPGYGSWPTEEVRGYLNSLPRRPMDWRRDEKQETLYAPADGWNWIEFAIPPEREYLMQPERPIFIRLTDERQFVLFPDGNLTERGGMKVNSVGDIPGAKLFLQAADRDAGPVRVTVSTRPK